jgi:YggT family protein
MLAGRAGPAVAWHRSARPAHPHSLQVAKSMAAEVANALLFLVKSLFYVAMGVFLLRILLQAVRADFYNPISQTIWRVTHSVSTPLQKILPRVRRFDTASAAVLFVLAFLYVESVVALVGVSVGALSAAWYALLVIFSLLVNLYTLLLLVFAILSWVGPGVSNPASNILWSLNEPLLRPVRRILPPLSGLDFSPMVVMIALQVVERLIPLPVLF